VLPSDSLLSADITIDALIINPSSKHLTDFIDGNSNIKSHIVENSIRSAQDLETRDLYKLSFNLKQYDLPPIVHGFLLNDRYLFLGFCEIVNGKLMGGIMPYISISKNGLKDSIVTNHFFNLFNHWFSYYEKHEDTSTIIDLRK
jgi:hypothetical protein